MSELEIIAATLGLANIVLIIRRSIWNYPFGIAMVCLYGWIFYDARLYSDALLQIFFVALNVYGWVHWTRTQQGGKVPVRWMTARSNVLYLVGTAIVWLVWSTAMARLTNAAAPYWDGAVACMSVTGQVLLARRHVENWVYWIIVDVFAIGLFWSRGLQPTAGLYAVFLVMAAVGFARWARATRRGEAPA